LRKGLAQIGVAPPGYNVPLVRVEVLLACCEAPCCDHVCKSSWLIPIGERRIPPLIFRYSLCLALAAVVAAQELEVVARVVRWYWLAVLSPHRLWVKVLMFGLCRRVVVMSQSSMVRTCCRQRASAADSMKLRAVFLAWTLAAVVLYVFLRWMCRDFRVSIGVLVWKWWAVRMRA
jgi:hypothetical protein